MPKVKSKLSGGKKRRERERERTNSRERRCCRLAAKERRTERSSFDLSSLQCSSSSLQRISAQISEFLLVDRISRHATFPAEKQKNHRCYFSSTPMHIHLHVILLYKLQNFEMAPNFSVAVFGSIYFSLPSKNHPFANYVHKLVYV